MCQLQFFHFCALYGVSHSTLSPASAYSQLTSWMPDCKAPARCSQTMCNFVSFLVRCACFPFICPCPISTLSLFAPCLCTRVSAMHGRRVSFECNAPIIHTPMQHTRLFYAVFGALLAPLFFCPVSFASLSLGSFIIFYLQLQLCTRTNITGSRCVLEHGMVRACVSIRTTRPFYALKRTSANGAQ